MTDTNTDGGERAERDGSYSTASQKGNKERGGPLLFTLRN